MVVKPLKQLLSIQNHTKNIFSKILKNGFLFLGKSQNRSFFLAKSRKSMLGILGFFIFWDFPLFGVTRKGSFITYMLFIRHYTNSCRWTRSAVTIQTTAISCIVCLDVLSLRCACRVWKPDSGILNLDFGIGLQNQEYRFRNPESRI